MHRRPTRRAMGSGWKHTKMKTLAGMILFAFVAAPALAAPAFPLEGLLKRAKFVYCRG